MIENLRGWFSSRKLKQKVRYLFLLIIGFYLVLFFFIYMVFIRKNMMDYLLESNYKTMISIGNNLNSELNTLNSMSRVIMADKNIATYLEVDAAPGSRYHHNAITSMYDISNAFKYVNSIYLYRANGNYIHIAEGINYVYPSEMRKESWFKEIVDAKGGYVIRINGGGAFVRETGEPLISLIRIVNDINTQKPIGLLVINLTDQILKDSLHNMAGADRQFFYCDSELNSLYPRDATNELESIDISSKAYGQQTKGSFGGEKVLSYYHVPNTPLVIAGIEKTSTIRMIPSEGGWIIVAVLAVTVLSLILVGVFISVTITTPIERLSRSMDSAKQGWLKRVSLKVPNDEIGHLKESYNNMLVAINHLIDELLENEKTMQKAELDALQEQIKPHFLYNTLDTIAYLALQESSGKVYDAIETLGNFYRKFLSKGSEEISLRDEIGIVKNYLALQKLRYEDVFEDQYELSEDILDTMVPKLILQPLVENSLYHGIRPKGEKGIIRISTSREEDKLRIAVYDSGIGMNEKQIEQLMLNNNKSFGFKRTIERIQYYYGVKDVYEIESVEGQFTRVYIIIPL